MHLNTSDNGSRNHLERKRRRRRVAKWKVAGGKPAGMRAEVPHPLPRNEKKAKQTTFTREQNSNTESTKMYHAETLISKILKKYGNIADQWVTRGSSAHTLSNISAMWTAGFRFSWRKMETAAQDRAEWRRVGCGQCCTES